MSGETPAAPGEPPRRIVFEIDRERTEIDFSLFFASWKHRLELGAIIAFCIVMMLFSDRNPITYGITIAALLLIDAYFTTRLLLMRRYGDDAFFIEHGVLVRRRPPRRSLRIPLNELDGVGVQRLIGGQRIVVLLRGDMVYDCPRTVERAEVVARRIMEATGLPRVAKIERWLPTLRATRAQLVMAVMLIIALAALYHAYDRLGWFVVPVAIVLLVGLGTVARRLRRDPRADIWYDCRNCGYDLSATDNPQCPECGEYQ